MPLIRKNIPLEIALLCVLYFVLDHYKRRVKIFIWLMQIVQHEYHVPPKFDINIELIKPDKHFQDADSEIIIRIQLRRTCRAIP